MRGGASGNDRTPTVTFTDATLPSATHTGHGATHDSTVAFMETTNNCLVGACAVSVCVGGDQRVHREGKHLQQATGMGAHTDTSNKDITCPTTQDTHCLWYCVGHDTGLPLGPGLAWWPQSGRRRRRGTRTWSRCRTRCRTQALQIQDMMCTYPRETATPWTMDGVGNRHGGGGSTTVAGLVEP
jgi:hypothetical protein